MTTMLAEAVNYTFKSLKIISSPDISSENKAFTPIQLYVAHEGQHSSHVHRVTFTCLQ